jgi:hypothetical protein
MDKKTELLNKIENILLDFASLYNEIDTSDLQSISTIKAREILNLMAM